MATVAPLRAAPTGLRNRLAAAARQVRAFRSGLSLTARLTTAMVAIAIIAVGAVAVIAARSTESELIPVRTERLALHASLFTGDLERYADAARADILAFTESVALRAIVRALGAGGIDPQSGTTAASQRQEFSRRLLKELIVKPSYYQFRVIGVADGGRELIRIDRYGPQGAPRIAPEAELQRQGHASYSAGYLSEGIRTAAGEVYVSPVELNREAGAIAEPAVPVLHVAAAIPAPDGQPFGIIVITLDMRPILQRLATFPPLGGEIRVVNASGDYLLHPAPGRAFAFERGARSRVQEEFPELARLVATPPGGTATITDPDGAAVFAAVDHGRLAGVTPFVLIDTLPLTAINALARQLQRATFIAAGIAAGCALLLAVLVARSISRPIEQMIAAVERVPAGELPEVPTAAAGAVGALARALTRMAAGVRDHTAELTGEIARQRRNAGLLRQYGERERLFTAVFESSTDAVVTKTLDGTITAWNPAAERLFGYSAAEAVGRPIDLIVPLERRDEARGFLSRIARGERIAHHETVRMTRDGRSLDVSLSISPVQAPSGEIIGAAKIARDITEQKLSERKLQLAVEALKRSNEALEQFATIASHDLQEPLRMVASYTELLAQRYQGRLDEQADKYIHHATDGARRLQVMVRDLLAYSRVSARMPPAAPVDSAAVLADVLRILKPAITRSGAEIAVGPLPVVSGDATELGQVLQNLVANALKFHGADAPVIHVEARREQAEWIFSIADNGIGIDPKHHARIFQMFQRLNPRSQYEGSGIGLAITQKLVERRGGRIWVDSARGRGSTFCFTMSPAEQDPILR
jgi:PAS domain S-box-containing protein